MITIKSSDGKLITSLDDWFEFSVKRAKQWKDGRSAKELAKAWFRTGKPQMPEELVSLLQSEPLTHDFQLEVAIPEKETVLDDFKGSGRNHDMILIGKTDKERLLISIEAKVDEPFGEKIGECLEAKDRNEPRSRVPDRIHQLVMSIFGHTNVQDLSVQDLRYQLLHAIAGTLIEARNQGASVAVLIIYEFVPVTGKSNKAIENEKDLEVFVDRLSNGLFKLLPQKLIGPFYVPGSEKIPSNIPLYIGKIEATVKS